MAFKDFLTVEGQRMLTKASTGTPITFTKMVMGSGYLAAGTSERNMDEVIIPVKTLSIQSVVLNDTTTVCIQSYFSNEEIEEGFYFREKGIYVTDGTTEVLAIYGNAGDTADFIDLPSVTVVEKRIRSVLTLTSEELLNVTLTNETNAIAPVILDTFTLDQFVSTATAQALQIGQVVVLSKKVYTYVGDDCRNPDCYKCGESILSDIYTEKVEGGDAEGGIGASQNALYNVYKSLLDSLGNSISKLAIKNHKSSTTEYGVGNETEYGHVKLSDSTSSDSDVDSGVAATPKALSTHVSDKSNPHGVTKAQVNLGNVPNVTTNNQTVTYTEASTLTKLSSGEKMHIAFGKIAKAISSLLSHIADKTIHYTTANNLTTTESGFALDARQGKKLNDRINKIYTGSDTLNVESGKVVSVKTELLNCIIEDVSDYQVFVSFQTNFPQLFSYGITKYPTYFMTHVYCDGWSGEVGVDVLVRSEGDSVIDI